MNISNEAREAAMTIRGLHRHEKICEIIQSTINTATEQLRRENEELRQSVHEATHGKYGSVFYSQEALRLQRDNDQLRQQVAKAREALNEVIRHKVQDFDGNHVCWIGETAFNICEQALAQLERTNEK